MSRPKVLRSQPGKAKSASGSVEDRVQAACKWMARIPSATFADATRKFDVPYHTLWRRYNKTTIPLSDAVKKRRLLDENQEQVIVEWAKHLGAESRPVDRYALLLKVEQICGRRPCLRWADAFRKRHPDVKFARPQNLDPTRAQCFNPATVSEHFRKVQEIRTTYHIKTSNTYNMDEKGIQTGGGRSKLGKKFYFSADDNSRYRMRSADLELVTILECVSADGESLTPGFVFSGGTYEEEWFTAPGCENVTVGVTENGWTDDEQCMHWFEESFIPQARKRAGNDDDAILLILDGHGSHITKEMHELGVAHNVHIYVLPPHTTHKLQPLDVGVFGPLQSKWTTRCGEVLAATEEPIERKDFVREYLEVRRASIGPDLVKGAWRKTGLEPFNPDIFSPLDFGPSHGTSIRAHVPNGFPLSATTHSPDAPSALDASSSASNSGMPSMMTSHEVAEEEESEQADEMWLDEDEDEDEDEECGDPDGGSEEAVDGSTAPQVAAMNIDVGSPQGGCTGPPSALGQSLPPSSPASPFLSSSNTSAQTVTTAFSPTRIDRRWSVMKRLDVLADDFHRLHDAYKDERVGRVSAETHCILAGHEIARLKNIANRKADTAPRRKLRVTESFLTGPKAAAAFSEQDRLRAEKEEEERKKKARKDEEEKENQRRRADLVLQGANTTFCGPLSSKKRADLLDLAHILALTIKTKSTRADIISMLTQHFDNNPALRTDPRFAGIFAGRTRARRAAHLPVLADRQPEMVPPPPSVLTTAPESSGQPHGPAISLAPPTFRTASPSPHGMNHMYPVNSPDPVANASYSTTMSINPSAPYYTQYPTTTNPAGPSGLSYYGVSW